MSKFKYDHAKGEIRELPSMEKPDKPPQINYYSGNEFKQGEYNADLYHYDCNLEIYNRHISELKSFPFSLPKERDQAILEEGKDFELDGDGEREWAFPMGQTPSQLADEYAKKKREYPAYVRFDDLPPGELFRYKDTIALKSEYVTGDAYEAYIVGTGEMFWGGTNTAEDLNNLLVIPYSLPLAIPLDAATGTDEGEREEQEVKEEAGDKGLTKEEEQDEFVKMFDIIQKCQSAFDKKELRYDNELITIRTAIKAMESYASQFRAATSNEVKSDAVEFADYIKDWFVPTEKETWMHSAKGMKRGDIPNLTEYDTTELYQLFKAKGQDGE